MKVFADPEFVKEGVLKWVHTHGPTWSWYEELVRETVQAVTGLCVESPAQITPVADERDHPVSVADPEPNGYTAPPDGPERE